jgi:hypothetical protein
LELVDFGDTVIDLGGRGDEALDMAERGDDQGELAEAGDKGALTLPALEDGLLSCSLVRCWFSPWVAIKYGLTSGGNSSLGDVPSRKK